MRIEVRLEPVPKTKLVLRRPPDDFLALLSKPSSELEALIGQIESHPLFRQLVSVGIVRKICFRSFTTAEQPSESAIKWLNDFIARYGIDKHPNWQADFFSPNAISRVEELARRYSVPLLQVRRALKRIRLLLAEEQREGRQKAVEQGGESLLEPTSSYTNLSEEVAQIEEFVKKYGIPERDFLKIWEGEMGVDELCARYGCSVPEARRLVGCINRVQIHEMFVGEEPTVKPLPQAVSGVSFEVVAYVSARSDGTLSIQFRDEQIYAARYVIDEEGLRTFLRSHPSEELERIVSLLRYINRWRSLLARVVWTICYHQRRFIFIGDRALLKPLSQAEVARELGHHRSHICRVIRHRGIATRHGKYPLSELCASKEQVIRSIAERYPEWTDRQIAEFLFVTHGLKIPRRTVSYHRAKVRRESERH